MLKFHKYILKVVRATSLLFFKSTEVDRQIWLIQTKIIKIFLYFWKQSRLLFKSESLSSHSWLLHWKQPHDFCFCISQNVSYV